MHLHCPRCRALLQHHVASGGYYCANKHHFDPAPEGFLDLIPGKKNPKDSDSRALLRAKRHFLTAGHQQPLVDDLATLLEGIGGEHELIHLGCGEGYFCRALAAHLPTWRFAGIERAQNAIFAANKAQPEAQFVIADPTHPPLAAAQAEVLLVNDLKLSGAQLSQWLRPGGHLLHIQPGPEHQWQLRTFLNPVSQAHPLSWPQLADLTLVAKTHCQFAMTLDQAGRALQLDTSRLGWRASQEQRHHYVQQGDAALTQDLLLTLWQKPLA
ncbi:MAG: putative RNA methyltransferase [Aeromonas sp.]